MKLRLLAAVAALTAQLTAQSPAFIENLGQWPDRVRFAAPSTAGTVWIEEARIGVFDRANQRVVHIDMPHAANVSRREPAGIASFFVGQDAAKWVRATPVFREIEFTSEDGLRVSVSTEQGRAKIAARNARFRLSGAASLNRQSTVFVERAPEVQRTGESSWSVEGPDVVVWAGFIGGTGVAHDVTQRPGTDTSILVGDAIDAAFPTTPGAFQVEPSSDDALAFVGELAPDGLSFAWSTYLGGNNTDSGRALSLLPDGNVAVAGFTILGSFPTTPGAYKETHLGSWDGFVSILNVDGTDLIASTFFGSDVTSLERPIAIECASSGNLVIAGSTISEGFPVTDGGIHGTGSMFGVGFVCTLSPMLDKLVMSSIIGGSQTDDINGLALDNQDRPIVVGRSQSLDFPLTQNAWSYQLPPTALRVGAFAARLSADGTDLEVSTMVGDAGLDRALDVAIQSNGEITVSGLSSAGSNFPVSPNAIKKVADQLSTDMFLSTFSRDLDELRHSTLFGAPGAELVGVDVVADSTGLVVLLGQTMSPTFPTTPGAFQPESATPGSGFDQDGVLTVFHPTGAPVLYSTYLPMGTGELGECALTANGDVVVVGRAFDASLLPESEGSTTGDGEAFQPATAMRLTPLPFGVHRASEPDAAPDGLLVQGVLSQPSVGARYFGSYCLHAPAWSNGWLLVSSNLESSSVAGASLDIDLNSLILVLPTQSNGRGWAERVLPIPEAPELAGAVAYSQWVWPDGSGGWLTSGALAFEVQ